MSTWLFGSAMRLSGCPMVWSPGLWVPEYTGMLGDKWITIGEPALVWDTRIEAHLNLSSYLRVLTFNLSRMGEFEVEFLHPALYCGCSGAASHTSSTTQTCIIENNIKFISWDGWPPLSPVWSQRILAFGQWCLPWCIKEDGGLHWSGIETSD